MAVPVFIFPFLIKFNSAPVSITKVPFPFLIFLVFKSTLGEDSFPDVLKDNTTRRIGAVFWRSSPSHHSDELTSRLNYPVSFRDFQLPYLNV